MEAASYIPKNQNPKLGETAFWQAPSNIALVKYWGKYEPQIPANPSLSFTLSHCKTKTKVTLQEKAPHLGSQSADSQNGTSEFSFDFRFEGTAKPDFHPKIKAFFNRVHSYLPFLSEYHFSIESENSFPHSSGIASSASAMAALSLCLLDLSGEFPEKGDSFYGKASFLARLGSGSASRSIQGPLMQWGQTPSIAASSDVTALKYEEIHEVFRTYQDSILLVDKGAKVVSSTVGHGLMENHPYAAARFTQAHSQIALLAKALKSGDLPSFIHIVEQEALTLHAMMLSSSPYFILMKPHTLSIIEKVWAFRKETSVPLCFTLDAGANVHLLYPEQQREVVVQFIENELVAHCENEQYICDSVGTGSSPVFE